MNTEHHTDYDVIYDVIVVGARCAGSPTAMLLARQGHRVLVLDRASFPSDTLSTHMVTPAGVAALDRWGLLDRVLATGCPPIPTWSFDFGPVTVTGTPHAVGGHSATYGPRRHLLDSILVDAAREAGAEVRELVNVDAVEIDETVDGAPLVRVRAHQGDGPAEEITARFVVGADGRNSHVARAVGALPRMEKPRLQYAYYTYFEDLPTDGFEVFIRPFRGFAAAGTNDGRTMVVVGWPYAESAAYKSDVEGNFLATIDAVPEFAERVRRARRVEPFLGGAIPGFVRDAYGAGWALVGDASYLKDQITAQGIADAFTDAEHCATGLDAWLTGVDLVDAFAPWAAARDARLPLYEFTAQMATLEPPPPEMQQLLGAAAGNPAAADGFASVVAGTLSPAEFFAPENIGAIMGAPV